jgi:parvulin-like peptidyl-prolyl isomerase
MILDSINPNNVEPGSEADVADGVDTPRATAPMDATAANDLPANSADHEPQANAPSAETKDRAVSTVSSGGMKTPTKVIVAILILAFIGASFLFIQQSSSSPKTVKLSKQDMQLVFQEMLSPQAQQMIASNPEEKKKLVEEVKKILAVAQVAEREGYAQRPEVEKQISFQTDMSLNQAYRKKNPEMKVSDEQVNAYYQAHPNDFDTFIQSDPRLAQQAQGPRREEIKKQFGEFKVVADLARKDRLDQDDATRLQMLIDRSQILRNAYLSELEKNADKLVTDADVEQYYNDHKDEFEEVRVRHILIGTQAPPGGDPSKALSKDEARKKAQSVLERARKGEDFVKLVEENSDDPGSKSKGGEYEFARKSGMVQAFEDASFNLKPGEISDLVETEFGYHIIKLEERRAGQPGDQKTRQKITDKIKQDKIEARVNEIAQSSSVEVPEDFDATPKPVEAAPMTSGGNPHSGEGRSSYQERVSAGC